MGNNTSDTNTNKKYKSSDIRKNIANILKIQDNIYKDDFVIKQNAGFKPKQKRYREYKKKIDQMKLNLIGGYNNQLNKEESLGDISNLKKSAETDNNLTDFINEINNFANLTDNIQFGGSLLENNIHDNNSHTLTELINEVNELNNSYNAQDIPLQIINTGSLLTGSGSNNKELQDSYEDDEDDDDEDEDEEDNLEGGNLSENTNSEPELSEIAKLKNILKEQLTQDGGAKKKSQKKKVNKRKMKNMDSHLENTEDTENKENQETSDLSTTTTSTTEEENEPSESEAKDKAKKDKKKKDDDDDDIDLDDDEDEEDEVEDTFEEVDENNVTTGGYSTNSEKSIEINPVNFYSSASASDYFRRLEKRRNN
jgi:hypothetical protein